MTGEAFFKPVEGIEIPGGCPDCDAVQVVDRIGPNVYGLTVRHDDTCPTYRRIVARRAREAS